MKRILILGATIAAGAIATMTALAASSPVPFPAPKVADLFVAAQTVTTDGVMGSWFTPGSSVVFRAYAVDPKTLKVVDPKTVRYFYVTIPNQPNVKLKYDPAAPGAAKGMPWTGVWSVPTTYPSGLVPFKVLVQVKEKNGHQLRGQFVQLPVAPSDLNISPTAPAPYSPAAPAGSAGAGAAGAQLNLALYVDSVNGTAPAGVQPRTIGCTQTNVYKRGERIVIRAWGTDLATGALLTNDNVSEAHFSIPGQPNVPLNWGAHGAVGAQVYFWSNFWVVPATFPLGETTVHVSFTTESGKSGTYDFVLNIIP
jgi:hypothetical protein